MNESGYDIFREKIAAEIACEKSAKLAHQSLGRPLSEAEGALADALLAIYTEGFTTPEAVAKKLTANQVAVPSSGGVVWTAELLHSELKRLNQDLDEAYQQQGSGA